MFEIFVTHDGIQNCEWSGGDLRCNFLHAALSVEGRVVPSRALWRLGHDTPVEAGASNDTQATKPVAARPPWASHRAPVAAVPACFVPFVGVRRQAWGTGQAWHIMQQAWESRLGYSRRKRTRDSMQQQACDGWCRGGTQRLPSSVHARLLCVHGWGAQAVTCNIHTLFHAIHLGIIKLSMK